MNLRRSIARYTPFDYTLVALNPALIIGMVTALLHFLALVFYQTEFQTRLYFILFFFVLGEVCVCRIAMEFGFAHAAGYGLPLAILTWVAISKFVEFQGPLASFSGLLVALLIAIAWYTSYKLTWDCTVLDNEQAGDDRGLLETSGLERADETAASSGSQSAPAGHSDTAPHGHTRRELPRAGLPDTSEPELDEHENHYRGRKPHPHGVWVVYFLVGALPLFGFGQRFLADAASRAHAVRLFCVYLGCAAALLSTTSLLGIRRYLWKRNLRMPMETTAIWLTSGAMIVGVVLLVSLLLPRPSLEQPAGQRWSLVDVPDNLRPNRWGFFGGVRTDGSARQQSASTDHGSGSSSPQQATGSGEKSRQHTQTSPLEGNSSAPHSASSSSANPPSHDAATAGDTSRILQQPGGNSVFERTMSSGTSPPGQTPPQAEHDQHLGQSVPDQHAGASSQPGPQTAHQASAPPHSPDASSAKSSPERPPSADVRRSTVPGGSDAGQVHPKSAAHQSATSSRSTAESSAGGTSSGAAPGARTSPSEQDFSGGERASTVDMSRLDRNASASTDTDSHTASTGARPESSTRGSGSPSRGGGASPRGFSPLQNPLASSVGALLQWLYWIGLFAVGAYLLWRCRNFVVAYVRHLWQQWQRLWQWWFGQAPTAAEKSSAVESPVRRSFRQMENPFVTGTGTARLMDLVRHSFQALEVWAADMGIPRSADETPLEFTAAVASRYPELTDAVSRLCESYCRLAYGDRQLPKGVVSELRELWRLMTELYREPAVHRRPMPEVHEQRQASSGASR